jgi:eukaryotic-like serine/threonine-protein kinase
VWRAADLASGQAVAVKMLDVFPAGDTAAQVRFRLVARTVAQLSAPGVAQVRESGEAELGDGRTVPYLVRDLVAGPTLDDRLNQGPLPAGEALRLVADVAGALDVAHRAGVAHGHLVPSNIVFGPGLVKITDFGLWPLRPRPAGLVPGGLSYTAPELAHGPATPAADMYALGVVFVACLAGIVSGGVSAAGPEAGMLGDAAQDPVPAGLAALWAACLRPNPGERPSAAHAAVMSRQMLPGRDGSAVAASTGRVPAPRAEPTLTELNASGPGSGEPDPGEPGLREPGLRGPGPDEPAEKRPGARRPAARTAARLAGQRPGPRPGRGGPRASRRRKRLITASGAAAAAAAVVVVGLLASSPGDRPASPASAATAAQARTAVAAGPSRSGRVPSPESTSSVLASSPPSPQPSPDTLSPLAAIDQLSLTVHDDVAAGQIRPDVGVDFGNLIDPVRSDLASGQPAPVAQLAGELRAKLWTRVSEGAVTVTAATVLNSELTALANSAG